MQERLQAIIAEILDIPRERVRPDMARRDTPEWDSMNHLRLVTAIEAEFGVALTMEQIETVQTPAELQQAIDAGGPTSSGGAGPGASSATLSPQRGERVG